MFSKATIQHLNIFKRNLLSLQIEICSQTSDQDPLHEEAIFPLPINCKDFVMFYLKKGISVYVICMCVTRSWITNHITPSFSFSEIGGVIWYEHWGRKGRGNGGPSHLYLCSTARLCGLEEWPDSGEECVDGVTCTCVIMDGRDVWWA